jgi:hypothetical protein
LHRAALELCRVAREAGLLERLSKAAQSEAWCRFDSDRAAGMYADLLEDLRGDPPVIAAPLPLRHWRYPRGLDGGGVRRFIPQRIKNLLRELRERIAMARVPSGIWRPGERS